ncbi:hypothetical protein LTR53_001254 [Teratosphaeriaceae sp. CCFEE 6253]|nr:hypothetical protein LTR53_001254 [Teratosphaeriaceae sp. CCFEE 6253]
MDATSTPSGQQDLQSKDTSYNDLNPEELEEHPKRYRTYPPGPHHRDGHSYPVDIAGPVKEFLISSNILSEDDISTICTFNGPEDEGDLVSYAGQDHDTSDAPLNSPEGEGHVIDAPDAEARAAPTTQSVNDVRSSASPPPYEAIQNICSEDVPSDELLYLDYVRQAAKGDPSIPMPPSRPRHIRKNIPEQARRSPISTSPDLDIQPEEERGVHEWLQDLPTQPPPEGSHHKPGTNIGTHRAPFMDPVDRSYAAAQAPAEPWPQQQGFGPAGQARTWGEAQEYYEPRTHDDDHYPQGEQGPYYGGQPGAAAINPVGQRPQGDAPQRKHGGGENCWCRHEMRICTHDGHPAEAHICRKYHRSHRRGKPRGGGRGEQLSLFARIKDAFRHYLLFTAVYATLYYSDWSKSVPIDCALIGSRRLTSPTRGGPVMDKGKGRAIESPLRRGRQPGQSSSGREHSAPRSRPPSATLPSAGRRERTPIGGTPATERRASRPPRAESLSRSPAQGQQGTGLGRRASQTQLRRDPSVSSQTQRASLSGTPGSRHVAGVGDVRSGLGAAAQRTSTTGQPASRHVAGVGNVRRSTQTTRPPESRSADMRYDVPLRFPGSYVPPSSGQPESSRMAERRGRSERRDPPASGIHSSQEQQSHQPGSSTPRARSAAGLRRSDSRSATARPAESSPLNPGGSAVQPPQTSSRRRPQRQTNSAGAFGADPAPPRDPQAELRAWALERLRAPEVDPPTREEMEDAQQRRDRRDQRDAEAMNHEIRYKEAREAQAILAAPLRNPLDSSGDRNTSIRSTGTAGVRDRNERDTRRVGRGYHPSGRLLPGETQLAWLARMRRDFPHATYEDRWALFHASEECASSRAWWANGAGDELQHVSWIEGLSIEELEEQERKYAARRARRGRDP